MLLPSTQRLILFVGLVLIGTFPITKAADTSDIPTPPAIAASSYLLEDFHTGHILAQKNADKKLPPASLTKIMTAYVVYKELAAHHLTLASLVTISKKAGQTSGSRMFVNVGSKVRVEDLLQGMIIQSGNDASVALAEHVAGNETAFAQKMNLQAARLKMNNSHFENSTGLPIKNHYTTARDLLKLTRALIVEFPEYYRWDSQKEFTYNKITQKNRNLLLETDSSVDGVKTGFTNDAGYCMVASARREDMRLISVVMGTASTSARANESQTLLNYGFHFYKTSQLYPAHKPLKEIRVWGGVSKTVQLGLAHNLYITTPRRQHNDVKATMAVDPKVTAPIDQGKSYGAVKVSFFGKELANQPLIALQNVPAGNFIQRMYDKVLSIME